MISLVWRPLLLLPLASPRDDVLRVFWVGLHLKLVAAMPAFADEGPDGRRVVGSYFALGGIVPRSLDEDAGASVAPHGKGQLEAHREDASGREVAGSFAQWVRLVESVSTRVGIRRPIAAHIKALHRGG